MPRTIPDDTYASVINGLSDNSGRSTTDISQATGVPQGSVRRVLQEAEGLGHATRTGAKRWTRWWLA